MSTLVKIANAHMRIRSHFKNEANRNLKKIEVKFYTNKIEEIEMRKGNKRLKNITRQDTHHET